MSPDRRTDRPGAGSNRRPRSKRRDELGRLNRALGHMAGRLDGYVNEQKRFLGDTAHELLSPLARLEVALSILEHQGGPTNNNPYAGRALEEVRHISTLVHDLLSFTKAGMHLTRRRAARRAAGGPDASGGWSGKPPEKK